jgi:hypothetical protein
LLENLKGGKRNSELNECTNMEFIHGAISATSRPQYIFKDGEGKLSRMRAYGLHELITERKLFFDVVHSDIQGAEVGALTSATPVLASIGYFVISTHIGMWNSITGEERDPHKMCLEYLNNNNFLILAEHTVAESYSGDGLIVAVNKEHLSKYGKNIKMDVKEYFRKNCAISKRKGAFIEY